MRNTQQKFVVLLMLALGLAIGGVSTVYAGQWETVNALGSGGYSARHQPAAGTLPQAGATVEVHSNFYLPASVTINVGDTVTWTRLEGFHNVFADDGSFRLGEANGDPGSSWTSVSHQFMQAGTFKYHCQFHGLSMAGVVIVQGNDDPITGLAATNNGPKVLGNATAFAATIISGTNVSYAWNFGDGKSGTGITTSHTYTATGVYTATVTATNSKGSQSVATPVLVTNAIIDVNSNFFAPDSVTIKVGDTVTWVRKSGFHNVFADDGSFRLGEPNGDPGGSWTMVSHQFTQAGTVKYHCQFHGLAMSGVVIVQAAAANTNVYLPLVFALGGG